MRFLEQEIAYAKPWRDLVDREDFVHAVHETETMIRPDAIANRMTPSGPEEIFRVLTVPHVRVVVVGQDPYFNAGEATGFAFEDGTIKCWRDLLAKPKAVPSLKRLLRKLHMVHSGNATPADLSIVAAAADTGAFPILPPDELFGYWAEQGVLLLNRRLSTRLGCPHGHKKAWEVSVNMIAAYVAARWPTAVWFLWGTDAQGLASHVPKENRMCASHPNPIYVSYKEPSHFIHTDCFARTPQIDWFGIRREYPNGNPR